MTFGDGARPGLGDETAERKVAEGCLVPFAQHVEQRRALCEVVVRIGGAAGLGVQAAAEPEVFTPRCGRCLRIDRVGSCRETLFRFRQTVGERQSFGGDERRLQGIEGRRSRLQDLIGQGHGLCEGAAAHGQPGVQDADGPFVPLARLASVRAVRFAGTRKKVGRGFVVAADQVHLGQRVEDGTRRLVKLNRAAKLEGSMQDVCGPIEIAQAHANLPEITEREGESMSRSVRFLEHHATLGEHQRLFVPVLHHHDAGLVAADGRQDIVGVDLAREAFCLTQCTHRLIVFSDLREQDA
jgi:hypothetical protein